MRSQRRAKLQAVRLWTAYNIECDYDSTVERSRNAVSRQSPYWPAADFMLVWKMAIHFPFSCFHTVPAL